MAPTQHNKTYGYKQITIKRLLLFDPILTMSLMSFFRYTHGCKFHLIVLHFLMFHKKDETVHDN